MKTQLQDYLERPKRYANIDGTGEMYMGLMLLGFALLSYLQTVLPTNSLWRTNGFASVLFMYAILVPVLGIGYWVGRTIKKSITWPRTGYVAYGVGRADAKAKKSFWATRLAIAVLAAVIGAGVAGLLAFERRYSGATRSSFGVGYVVFLTFWVLAYAFWVWRMGRAQPWKWLVLLFLALGLLVIGLTGPADLVGLSRPVMLFVGLVWVISGVATLCSYLRHTQPPAPQAE